MTIAKNKGGSIWPTFQLLTLMTSFEVWPSRKFDTQVAEKMTHDLTKIDTGLKGNSVGISLICSNFNLGGFDAVF